MSCFIKKSHFPRVGTGKAVVRQVDATLPYPAMDPPRTYLDVSDPSTPLEAATVGGGVGNARMPLTAFSGLALGKSVVFMKMLSNS